MSKTKHSSSQQIYTETARDLYGDAYNTIEKEFIGEGVTHVQAKQMYEEQFKELITLLMPMPNDDKERLMKAAIKFYGLDHVLRSECSY